MSNGSEWSEESDSIFALEISTIATAGPAVHPLYAFLVDGTYFFAHGRQVRQGRAGTRPLLCLHIPLRCRSLPSHASCPTLHRLHTGSTATALPPRTTGTLPIELSRCGACTARNQRR